MNHLHRLTGVAFATAVAVLLGWMAVSVRSQESPTTGTLAPDSDDAMRQKLVYSQRILDGLVTEDFDKILRSARALNEFGKQKWTDSESVAYATQNQVFWFTTGALVMAAESKNIDGATLAYTQMTHACVNCHKVIRRQ